MMRRLLVIAVLLALPGAALQAQPKGPPNALQGFSQNRDQPVHIEAATLVVRDKDKVATFSGHVQVRQGDTAMRCRSLVVFYEQESGKGGAKNKGKNKGKDRTMTAATPGPGGEQRIKRLEARGNVVVTRNSETATGDLGVFDMQTNTVTLTGHVVMTEGHNVLRGGKLVVDLTTGVSRVESGKDGRQRVQGLFLPSGGMPNLKGGARAPLGPLH